MIYIQFSIYPIFAAPAIHSILTECANQKLKKCDTWRECLELNYYVDLVNKLNIQGIVAELRQHRLITQPLYDEITGTVVGQTANTLYIQHLVRTGVEETFGKFVKVLEETSQDFAIHREILNTFWCDAMLGTIVSSYVSINKFHTLI